MEQTESVPSSIALLTLTKIMRTGRRYADKWTVEWRKEFFSADERMEQPNETKRTKQSERPERERLISRVVLNENVLLEMEFDTV